jgi:hypothetical protein
MGAEDRLIKFEIFLNLLCYINIITTILLVNHLKLY